MGGCKFTPGTGVVGGKSPLGTSCLGMYVLGEGARNPRWRSCLAGVKVYPPIEYVCPGTYLQVDSSALLLETAVCPPLGPKVPRLGPAIGPAAPTPEMVERGLIGTGLCKGRGLMGGIGKGKGDIGRRPGIWGEIGIVGGTCCARAGFPGGTNTIGPPKEGVMGVPVTKGAGSPI